MSYVAQQPRKRFNFRLNEAERKQITFIMQREGIPDAAKAIRYCIAEHARRLNETPQEKEGRAA